MGNKLKSLKTLSSESVFYSASKNNCYNMLQMKTKN